MQSRTEAKKLPIEKQNGEQWFPKYSKAERIDDGAGRLMSTGYSWKAETTSDVLWHSKGRFCWQQSFIF